MGCLWVPWIPGGRKGIACHSHGRREVRLEHATLAVTDPRSRATPSRAAPRVSEPPSDAEIERGLRERAVSDPRAAEILLPWLQRPRVETSGLGLKSMSEAGLEVLYSGLLRLAAFTEEELEHLLSSMPREA